MVLVQFSSCVAVILFLVQFKLINRREQFTQYQDATADEEGEYEDEEEGELEHHI